jgi:putative spermidine/putrescine transport system substrate-binding protein
MSRRIRGPWPVLVGLVPLIALSASCTSTPGPTPTLAPAATGSPAPQTPAPTATSGPRAWAPDPALLAAAQAEGALTTIALPPDWCNYQDLLDRFATRTGIALTNLLPTGSSQEELAAIAATPPVGSAPSGSPPGPDVVDVSARFGPIAASEGLLAPYKVSTWSEIPDAAKDPGGAWYGDYYGVISFEVNTSAIGAPPLDWPDLLAAPKGSVALSGDPTRSTQGAFEVWAAGLASGAADAPQAGLTWFKSLADAGVLQATLGTGQTVASGLTPIRLAWTYDALGDADSLAGQPPVKVVIPAHGRLAGMDVQGISARAAHPNAAKLWMEWLYSDEGQSLWFTGYCTPIRYEAMRKAGTLPAEVLAHLPDMTGALLPSLDEVTTATGAITKGWPTVGVQIQAGP